MFVLYYTYFIVIKFEYSYHKMKTTDKYDISFGQQVWIKILNTLSLFSAFDSCTFY